MQPDAIHLCPHCELRYPTVAEWRDHVEHGHAHAPADPGARPSAPTGRLVVAVDPARSAGPEVAVAAATAHQTGQTLDLVAVVAPGLGRASADAFLRSRVHEARRAEVGTIAWSVLEGGKPADLLIDHVAGEPGTVLCLGTRARGPVRELLLGSVSAEVLRRCPVPVLLVGPRCLPPAEGFHRIVACVDGSERSEPVLAIATRIAHLTGLPTDEFRAARGPWVEDDGEVLGPAPSLGGEAAAEAILAVLGGDPGTVAVMATEGRRGLDQLLFESVALDVVREARGPVLLLPPSLTASGPGPSPLVNVD